MIQLKPAEGNLEAFIYTNGRSLYEYSLRSLREQTFPIRVTAIRDKSMEDAMKYALRKCRSKYFLKIDDDFLLHKRAVEFMWWHLAKREKRSAAMYWWHLWEEWSGNPVQSIKIYNTAHAKRIGFSPDNEGRVDIRFIGKIRRRGKVIIRDQAMPALHACAPWQEQLKYIHLWRRSSKSGRHHKIRTTMMRKFHKTIEDQFSGRNALLESINKRYKTMFYRFITLHKK